MENLLSKISVPDNMNYKNLSHDCNKSGCILVSRPCKDMTVYECLCGRKSSTFYYCISCESRVCCFCYNEESCEGSDLNNQQHVYKNGKCWFCGKLLD